LTHRVLYNSHLHTSRTFTSLVLALEADPEQLPTLAIVPPPSPALPSSNPPRKSVWKCGDSSAAWAFPQPIV